MDFSHLSVLTWRNLTPEKAAHWRDVGKHVRGLVIDLVTVTGWKRFPLEALMHPGTSLQIADALYQMSLKRSVSLAEFVELSQALKKAVDGKLNQARCGELLARAFGYQNGNEFVSAVRNDYVVNASGQGSHAFDMKVFDLSQYQQTTTQ